MISVVPKESWLGVSFPFSKIHGLVGLFHQHVAVSSRLWIESDAKTCRDVHYLATAQLLGLRHRVQYSNQQTIGFLRGMQPTQHQAELIAAQAGGRVMRPHRGLQSVG